LGGRGRQISEFKASLVYRVSSRTARAIQRNHVSKTKQNKTKQNKTTTTKKNSKRQEIVKFMAEINKIEINKQKTARINETELAL
jgi:flagellar basal body P-ring protein FlgI